MSSYTAIINIKTTQEFKELARLEAHRHNMQLSEYIRWLIEREATNK